MENLFTINQGRIFGKIDAKKIAIILVALSIAAIIIVFAYFIYPTPGGDSFFFVPAAINFSLKGELSNKITDLTSIVDPTGAGRFLYYVPLFPVLLKYLMFTPTSQGASLAIALINSIVIALSALVFYKIATFNKIKFTWFNVFVISMSLLGLATTLGINVGRPEILARLFFVIAFILAFYILPERLWLLFSLLLGLMGATQPIGAIIFAIIMGIFFSIIFNTREAIKTIAKIYISAVVVFLSVMLLAPFSIADKINGILKHASLITVPPHADNFLSIFFHYYFLDTNTTFFGLILLFSSMIGLWMYFRCHNRIHSSKLFVVFIILLLLIVLYSIIYPNHVYNILIFSPLFFGAIVYFLRNVTYPIYLKVIIVAVVTLSSIGFLRAVALFPFFLKDGVSLNEAKFHFQKLKDSMDVNEIIGVSDGLWPILDSYNNIRVYPPQFDLKQKNYSIILQQQNYSGLTTPLDVVDNCPLKENMFIFKNPKIFGIKLANTMPGYAYAVYECPNKKNENSSF